MDNKNSNIDNDFVDIAKENNNTIYIIVGILYFIVIILSIFLIIGVKNQKDVVEDNIKENTNNKVNIEIDKRLIERFLGELEGKTVDLYNSELYWNYDLNSNDQGVERVQDLLARVTAFYNDLIKKHSNETVLIVAHGAVVRALHFVINGYNQDTKFLEFDVPNCCCFTYEIN